MTLWNCIDRAMNDTGEDGVKADRERGERAQAMWKDRAERYERDGHPKHVAEALAAEDVREGFRREAGEKRHTYLSLASFQRKAQAHVANTAAPDMTRRMEQMDYKHRGMVRMFNGRLSAYLQKHHRNILGNVTNPAEQANLIDELHGISTGDKQAIALADGIRNTIEDLRLMFNEAGGLASKLDNFGLPHVHSRFAVMRAGFEKWSRQIEGRLDWSRILDPLTGRAMPIDSRTGLPPESFRRSFLKEAYDNIVFSKEADDPVYGRPKGVATYRKHSDSRVLHFKTGRDWMDYNKDFGTGGIHQSLMGHVHRMARDIVLMREFGPNPKLGAEYEADLWSQKAKKAGDETMVDKIAGDSAVALRMLNIMSGGNVAQEPWMQWVSKVGSTTRQALTAAFLDRAIIASVSDLNSLRMAARVMGLNRGNIMARQVGLMKTLSKSELTRAGWVADTMADAGTALARFQQEVAPAEWAERVSNASMRIQGLSAWTDRGRATAYQEYGGLLAENADKPLEALPPALQGHLRKWNVSPADWDAFRAPEHLFRTDTGATFLMPIHARRATSMRADRADDLFFKMQGAAEEFLELAIPTRSLLGQAFTDPAALNIPPGHPLYELVKSGTMFKSFPITFSINQYRQIKAQGGILSAKGFGYAADLIAGATVMGAIAIQIGDLLFGRDPQDMTDPGFWGRAMAKGGGFGVLGDIVTTGSSSWNGGFKAYVAGPIPGMVDDIYGLTLDNIFTLAAQVANGDEIDTNFAKELARFAKRYTPMGQTPAVGPAIDRLVWDQMQLYLDPDSVEDMVAASKKRQKQTGAGEFWLPGSALPSRLPDLGTAIGG